MSGNQRMTPKQEAFVREYLIDLNASAAARRAGYAPHRADAMGHENLRKPEIAAAIAEAKAQRSERTKIDSDWVLRTLAEEKTADLADLYDEAGQIKPIKDWPMAFRRGVVVGVETVEEWQGAGEDRKPIQVRKIKLTDRTKHIELIGKHVNVQAFRDNIGLSDADGKALLPNTIRLVGPDDRSKA
jgi:phage terminase small subunit